MNVSDAYVRDHLLIQFMLDNYAPLSFSDEGKRFVEEIYKNWKSYLTRLEANHARK